MPTEVTSFMMEKPNTPAKAASGVTCTIFDGYRIGGCHTISAAADLRSRSGEASAYA